MNIWDFPNNTLAVIWPSGKNGQKYRTFLGEVTGNPITLFTLCDADSPSLGGQLHGSCLDANARG